MSSNLTGEEKKRIMNELRNALFLALRYSRGENANYIRVSTHVREGLDKLDKLEEDIT